MKSHIFQDKNKVLYITDLYIIMKNDQKFIQVKSPFRLYNNIIKTNGLGFIERLKEAYRVFKILR